jgi:hypothetical protein
MPEQFTSTTFKDVYKDDYLDSDGYHKILFNSGRALQARELTQLQTILQRQISRFANNIFQDGAAISVPSGGGTLFNTEYVIVEEWNNSTPSSYVGVIFQGPVIPGITGGLQFEVTHQQTNFYEDDNAEYTTLYGRYVSNNQNQENDDIQPEILRFSEGDTITDIRTISGITPQVGELVVRTKPANSLLESVGRGLGYGVQTTEFYVQEHFVYAPSQKIIVGEYSTDVDAIVGFEVKQDVVTVLDSNNLYDNQGARPNLSSPGADRYRIRMELLKKSQVAEPANFVSFAWIRMGAIIAQKDASSGFNRVEERMAIRTKETSGNFVANDFLLRFEEDDSDTFTLDIPHYVNGNNPVAYVDGFRLIHDLPEEMSVAKPLTFSIDSETSSNITYKNYVQIEYNSDTSTEMDNYNGGDLKLQQLHKLWNGTTEIGTARIKGLKFNGTNDEDHIRIHLYDIQMDDNQTFRNVDRIGMHTDTAANTMRPYLEDGNLYIVEPRDNDSLFLIPGGRVKSVVEVNFQVQRQFTDMAVLTNGNVTVSARCGSNETFEDEGQWIVLNITTNSTEVIVPGNVTVTNQDAVIEVSGNVGDDYVIWAYVGKTDVGARSKTYTEDYVMLTRSTTDRFDFDTTLYDGYKLLELNETDSAGTNYINAATFDGGQRDNFYQPAHINSTTIPQGVTTLQAKVAYFEWGNDGDYFSVNSYDISDRSVFDYGSIPSYQSRRTGDIMPLHNYFDFRSKLDPSATTMLEGDRFELPRDGDLITYDVEWYHQRIDHLCIGYDKANFRRKMIYNKGVPSLEPLAPQKKPNEMILYTINMMGNTKNVEDMTIEKMEHKRYRMSEIARLDKRITNLEDTLSLTLLEVETSTFIEYDASGNVRVKSGFFADDFTKGYALTAGIRQNEYIEDPGVTTSALDVEQRHIYPKQAMAETSLMWDEDNLALTQNWIGITRQRTTLTNNNIVRKGDLIMLEHEEVLDETMKQEVISWYSDDRSYEERGYYNVNPFNVFQNEGFLQVRPSIDRWMEQRRLPDNIINGGTQEVNIGAVDRVPRTWTERTLPVWWTRRGDPNWRAFRPGIRTFREIIRSRVISDQVIEQDLGDVSVSLGALPFLRQRRIIGDAKGLRPFTRYWLYFGDVDVSQWTLSLANQGDYETLFNQNIMNQNYEDVNVTLNRHPFSTAATSNVLKTDEEGKLYFDFWLPNNARIPTGDSFSSIEEWEAWIEAQRSAAAQYNGSKDYRVMNQIGWKFRAGTQTVKLLDVSDNAEEFALSKARTTYSGQGSVNLIQRQIMSTRVITTEFTSEVTRGPIRWIDPLAQSFTVDASLGVPGVFVTSIDVFIRSAPQTETNGGTDPSIPLQMQIRPMENGTPVGNFISEQHRAYRTADDVYEIVQRIIDTPNGGLEDLKTVLDNPVTFTFPEPFFLQAGAEFAIVLLAECDKYQAFCATTYDLHLGTTNRRVHKQPSQGSLFLSQNGSTWTPKQNQDLAYRIKTAKFKEQGTTNFYNAPLPKFRHNQPTTLNADETDLTRFRVQHYGHGLGVGDLVGMTGLDSSGTYGGVTGSEIMNPLNQVAEADIGGYFVELASGDTFNANSGFFGSDSVRTNYGFNFDLGIMNMEAVELTNTFIQYDASHITGYSWAEAYLTESNDPRYDVKNQLIQNRFPHRFLNPRYMACEDAENDVEEGQNQPSLVVGATLNTAQVSNFGINNDSSQSAYTRGFRSDVSPFIDMQGMGYLMKNSLIDNQPRDSANTAGELFVNTPTIYVPETHPTAGTSPSKHITRVIGVPSAANGLRIFAQIYRPPVANIDLYYRVAEDIDVDLYDLEWVYLTPDTYPPANPETPVEVGNLIFSEYSWLAGGSNGDLPDFNQFQIKIVFKTTNTTQLPVLRNIRTIAVI